ncbi:hypothetical protein [Cetobacterium sp. SF1]|uniref:hypothetical protein n=1 Tax=Cetobacterium sp. SF1 TaxID=3417654 RepID=UPI003CF4839F
MKKYILLFFTFSLITYSKNYTMTELLQLKKDEKISQIEFEILKNKCMEKKKYVKTLYTLRINNHIISNDYILLENNNDLYFDLFLFLKQIKLENIKKTTENIIINLKNEVNFSDENIVIPLNTNKIYNNKDNIFIRSDYFKELFCNDLKIDREYLVIDLNFKYFTKENIDIYLDSFKKEKIESKSSFYKTSLDIFSPGEIEFNFNKTLRNDYNSWYGSINYKTELLYGNFKSNYDLKNKYFRKTSLSYDNLVKNHILEIDNINIPKNKIWTLNLYKNDGYFEKNSNIIIRVKVPEEARGELIFLNQIIDTAQEKNGELIFKNSLIKRNNDYTIKIYNANGTTDIKHIVISSNDKLQKEKEYEQEGQILYSKNTNKIDGNYKIYYGINNKLTVGAGIIKQKSDYLDGNIIYGENIGNLSYNINLHTIQNTSKSKDYERSIEIETNYKKIKNTAIFKQKSELDKKEESIHYLKSLYYFAENSSIGIYNKKENNTIIMSPEMNSIINVPNINGLISFNIDRFKISSTFSTTYKSTLFHLSGIYDFDKGELDGIFKIAQIRNNFLNYSFLLKYSNKNKLTCELNFSAKYNDWLEIFSQQNISSKTWENGININKKFNLSDLTHNDPVHIIPFVDLNNNGIFDNNEKILENVAIKLNDETKITEENKPLIFENIMEGIPYPMDITLREYGYKAKFTHTIVKKPSSKLLKIYIPMTEDIQ